MGDDYGEGQHRHHGDDADCLHHDSCASPDRHVDVGHRIYLLEAAIGHPASYLLEADRVGLPVGHPAGCLSSYHGALPLGSRIRSSKRELIVSQPSRTLREFLKFPRIR